ncbi:MAG: hypothetical protein ACI8WB_004817 [Phenylobacterium sp.]|jgi:hypothetical protein
MDKQSVNLNSGTDHRYKKASDDLLTQINKYGTTHGKEYSIHKLRQLRPISDKTRDFRETCLTEGLEYRQRIGQGIHDRVEGHVFGKGELSKADENAMLPHMPLICQYNVIDYKVVKYNEIWDVTNCINKTITEGKEVHSFINVKHLIIEDGGRILSRGDVLSFYVGTLIRRPSPLTHLSTLSHSQFAVFNFRSETCQLKSMMTSDNVTDTDSDNLTNNATLCALAGIDGNNGNNGDDGEDGDGYDFNLRIGGIEILSTPTRGLDGTNGTDGLDGDYGRKGGNGKIQRFVELVIFDLKNWQDLNLTIHASAGEGGCGGNGGHGGIGGKGGLGWMPNNLPQHKTIHPQSPYQLEHDNIWTGNNGISGAGGAGASGGRGGHGGLASNIIIVVPEQHKSSISASSSPARGGEGGRGGITSDITMKPSCARPGKTRQPSRIFIHSMNLNTEEGV